MGGRKPLPAVPDRARRQARLARLARTSFAAAFSTVAVGGLASAGGIGYAADGVSSVADRAERIVGARDSQRPARIAVSPAQDQYRERVDVCHRTGSQRNPYVRISNNRADLPAHLAHGDIHPVPPNDCPTGGGHGARAGRTRDGNRAAGRASGESVARDGLPFTGVALGSSAVVGGVLIGIGFVLRRRARTLA